MSNADMHSVEIQPMTYIRNSEIRFGFLLWTDGMSDRFYLPVRD